MAKIWPGVDVLNEGFIDCSKGPGLLRDLVDDAEIDNSLQVQYADDVGEAMGLAQFRPNAISSPWSAPPAPPAPSGKIDGAYTKEDHKTEFYDREVPA